MQAVFPGRPQAKLQALSVGLWEAKQIIAYISGNALVILGGPTEVLQSIYHDEEEELEAVTLDQNTGKIAACSTSQIYIYEPSKLQDGSPTWSRQTAFALHGSKNHILTLSWGLSSELLVGSSSSLTLLSTYTSTKSSPPSKIWTSPTSSPVKLGQFSPDASLIASTARCDRLVKIWRRLSFAAYDNASADFDCSYLRHPKTVVGLHWRRPHHIEQVHNVLYSICSDKIVRVWAQPANPHGLQVMELWVEIDLMESLRPRTLPTENTRGQKRYVFVVDAKDLAAATESAVQAANEEVGPTREHALAHLKEVASRKPELLVILDGRGNMSAWGLESVGCKARKKGDVFNVAHVEGLPLKFAEDGEDEGDIGNVQFQNFPARGQGGSFVILAHHFQGVIEWWEGTMDRIFDLEKREDRLSLKARWAGHWGSINKIEESESGAALMSYAEDGQGIVWVQNVEQSSLSLKKKSLISTRTSVHGICLLRSGDFVVLLHTERISLWDTRPSKAGELISVEHGLVRKARSLLVLSSENSNVAYIASLASDLEGVIWEIEFAQQEEKTNGHAGTPDASLKQFCRFKVDYDEDDTRFSPVNEHKSKPVASGLPISRTEDVALSCSSSGKLTLWTVTIDRSKQSIQWLPTCIVETGVSDPAIASCGSLRKAAVSNQERTGLSVFDMKDAHLEYEERFIQDKMQAIKWTSTPEGQFIFAVSFGYHVVLYAQMRYDYLTSQQPWMPVRRIDIERSCPRSIGSIAWLSHGCLVVGAGSQLYLCDTQVQLGDGLSPSPSSQVSAIVGEETGDVRLFEVVSRLNCPLPVWHPQLLLQCTHVGKMRLAVRILKYLHKAVLYYSEGDEIDSLLGISPEMFYQGTTSRATGDNKMVQSAEDNFSSSADADEEDFTPTMASTLKSNLSKVQLPYLSAEEQSALARLIGSMEKLGEHVRSVDENATRFLLPFWFESLKNPKTEAKQPRVNGFTTKSDNAKRKQDEPLVGWREICWASRSQSQDILVDLVSMHFESEMTWANARSVGLGFWLSDMDALKAQLEIIARNEYTRTEERNPVDCSLYYLALRKKNVLQGLWRVATSSREQAATQRLLANNFQDPRWKTAALKNAYALMGKRRFEYAAAFFLLAGHLKDAVGVLAGQLGDVQLAVAVARVYEGDGGPVLREFVEEKVIPKAVDDGDRWCLVWAFEALGYGDLALKALVAPLHTLVSTAPTPAPSFRTEDPSLVILYKQLRDQSHRTHTTPSNGYAKASHAAAAPIQPREEWDFVMKHVRLYLRMGCTLLALDLVRNFTFTAYSFPTPERRPEQTVASDVSSGRRSSVALPSNAAGVSDEVEERKAGAAERKKPPKEAFQEPSASSLLDSFGF